jgi:hypothetical protein
MSNQHPPTDAAAVDHAPPGPAASAEPASASGGPSGGPETIGASRPQKKDGKVSFTSYNRLL